MEKRRKATEATGRRRPVAMHHTFAVKPDGSRWVMDSLGNAIVAMLRQLTTDHSACHGLREMGSSCSAVREGLIEPILRSAGLTA